MTKLNRADANENINVSNGSEFGSAIWLMMTCYFYRPQRSCGKVIFLHLSGNHSVHRGGGVCHTPLPPGRHLQADPPRAATAADGTHPTGMLSCSLSVVYVYLSLQLRLQEQWRDISYLNLALEDALQSRFSHVADR